MKSYNSTFWKEVTLALTVRSLPLRAGKLYYQMSFIRFKVLFPHLSTVHHVEGCLNLKDVHQLERLYQSGFLTQDLFFLSDMYNYQNMIP